MFAFQFVNSYSSLFYIAFIQVSHYYYYYYYYYYCCCYYYYYYYHHHRHDCY